MTPSTTPSVELLISPHEGRRGPLYPDQAADFDLALRNAGGQTVTVNSLEGNLDTPVIRIFGPQGPIGQFTPRVRREKTVGHGSTVRQTSPSRETLEPGTSDDTWVNLLAFHESLPPGTYSFDVVHSLDGAGSKVTSARQKFDIVPAHVGDAAFGYDSRDRSQSLLAWTAAAEGSKKLRLLVRESGFTGHASLDQGGTVLGEFDAGSRIAISQRPWDDQTAPVDWIAVFSPEGAAELIPEDSTFSQGDPVRVALGIRNPAPVPRFPNFGDAVPLATGLSAKGAALAGALVPEEGAAHSWLVPIHELPRLSACAFTKAGSIQVLLVSDDGRQSTVRKLEVDRHGKVLSPEQTVYATPHAIVAAVSGQRSPLGFFYILEADRTQHNRVALLRIPATGENKIATAAIESVKGWPTVRTGEVPAPAPAESIRIEQTRDGRIWAALTARGGDLYCGPLDGTLSLIREAKGSPLQFPFIADLRGGLSCFGFLTSGEMFAPGGGGH